ncbi:MAG TPA: YtxH domain-containing protein [Verrucomicrobiae bacterium]|nr:YtxH domain-containing protein [Verrucomicrobiae bacterium]
MKEDEVENVQDTKKVGKLAPFLAGAAVGAALGFLLTPKAGSEVRETVRDLADTAMDKFRELTEEAQVKLMEALEEGKEKLLEKKSVLSSAIQAGREAMAAAEQEREVR